MVVQTRASSPVSRRRPDRHGGVLAVLVDVVVHPQLVVGQRRLVVPAVREDPEALVDQPLVVELLERPDHRLHVVRLERLVVVVEVDPARLARDVGPPVVGVAQHRLAALGVEGLETELEDLLLGLDPQLAHRLQLGGQTVGVPAEPALDASAAHRLVPRHDVLDVAGEQVAVVRQPVGERRAVVEDELVRAVHAGLAVLDRRDEGPVLVPVLQDALLDLREARAGRDVRVRRRLLAHQRVGSCGSVCGWSAPRGRRHRFWCHRGTTPLAAHRPRRSRTRIRPLLPKAVTGPPVRVYCERTRSVLPEAHR